MKKYLVTGASGEVGGVLARMLLEKGVPVRVLVRSEEQGKEFKALGAEIAVGDLRDKESLKRACEGIYGVHHIAAVYREAGLSIETFQAVNAIGVRNIFEAGIESGVRRIIHCSTGGVLGDITNPPGSDKTPYNPGDYYQESKVEGEKIALEFYRSGRMRGAVIRPAMVYGPGDTRHRKLFRMIARKQFFFVGPGDKQVHFIDIRDLARSFVLAMEHEEINGEIYHIAGSGLSTLKEVVNEAADIIGVKRPWLHLPVKLTQTLGTICEAICRPFGIDPPLHRRRVDFFTKNRCFDTSKAAKELGFNPTKPFNEELREAIEFYRARGEL